MLKDKAMKRVKKWVKILKSIKSSAGLKFLLLDFNQSVGWSIFPIAKNLQSDLISTMLFSSLCFKFWYCHFYETSFIEMNFKIKK